MQPSAVFMLLCLLAGVALAQAPVRLAEPFENAYTGEDATGDHVIALWQFEPGAETADSSGNGHELRLKGAQFVATGRFGGGLESFRGWPDVDQPHQAIAANRPELSPKGAFTIELWICPKPDLEGYPEAFVLDKKYVDQTDYQLTLSAAGPHGSRRWLMRLGFGAETVTWQSDDLRYEPGVWHHVAFVYDGAGTGSFYIDGRAMGSTTQPGYGSIAPGTKDLHIGDRVGSYYHGFPGYIDEVRICKGALQFLPARFRLVSRRRAFVRMEQGASLSFELTNHRREELSGARASFALGSLPALTVDLPTLPSGARHPVELPLDTTVRPDEYPLRATIELPGDPPYRSTETFAVTIVPRPLPHRMPVVMWGSSLDELDRLLDIGFTHCTGPGVDLKAVWDAGQPVPATTDAALDGLYPKLDRALARGFGVYLPLSPGSWLRSNEALRRVGRDGKLYEKSTDICASRPEIREFCYNVGRSAAQTYGDHPAVQAALIHTEVRDDTQLCFHDHDCAAFRAFAGYDIPEQAAAKWGTPYTGLEGFPADRVIPDDDPLLTYYRWFWTVGDGWNALHTAVHEGLKSTGRTDLWTWFDPAVRVPSVYGSGGDVDVISQWTYSYPDPIRIGLATDELFCMAHGAARGDQRVMKMTQVIWYRSQTAPEPGDEVRQQDAASEDRDGRPQGTGTVDAQGRYVAEWERRIPDARFITIAPMHLREAFWTKIARPIQGIMYHGWQSLVEVPGSTGYRYTHPETKNELRRLVRSVVEPLGPTLMQVPDAPTDVALLESFTAQMLARRGTWGWGGGWGGDVYHILCYAQLQPRIIYDQTVIDEGLDAYKVLVAPDCDVLTRSVVDRILAFQARGGIVIGDDRLCPAIQADIVIPSATRPKEADMARAALMEAAENLRGALDGRYQRYYAADEPSIVTHLRRYGTSDYLFAVNDAREFGDYVGHHGLVMENGLPVDANLILRRAAGHVYDLVEHHSVEARAEAGSLVIPVSFGPCEGKLYLVTDQPVAGMRVTAPEQATAGEDVTIEVAVLGGDGNPLAAIVPVRVEILDPAGRPAEYSGYYGARDGQVRIAARLAANDVPGVWRVRATELASGRSGDAYVRVVTPR